MESPLKLSATGMHPRANTVTQPPSGTLRGMRWHRPCMTWSWLPGIGAQLHAAQIQLRLRSAPNSQLQFATRTNLNSPLGSFGGVHALSAPSLVLLITSGT